jgi:predicted DNA binding protein
MSVHVSVSVPAEHFVLQQFPEEVRIELERCVPFDGEPTPYLWVAGNDESRHVEGSTGVQGIESVAQADGKRLVRAEWRSGHSDVFDALCASDSTCLSGFRERNMWNLTLRFPSAESVSEWYRACPESGNHVTVRRVQTGEPPRTARAARLADPQRETLRIALETGYFAVPRQISLGELSDRQEISDVAVSQRLRRGIESLLVERFGDLRP